MIVKLLRPRADHHHWQVVDKEGRIARYVPKGAPPERVAAQAREAEASYWFASMAEDRRIIIHDPVPPQAW